MLEAVGARRLEHVTLDLRGSLVRVYREDRDGILTFRLKQCWQAFLRRLFAGEAERDRADDIVVWMLALIPREPHQSP
jgi:hypothetical protein